MSNNPVCGLLDPQRRALKALFLALFLNVSVISADLAMADLDELRLGVLNELTGPVASLGAVCTNGMQIALNQKAPDNKVNGVPVRMVIGDARDDVSASLSEFQRMTQVERVHLVASVRSKSALPLNPLAQRLGLPFLGIVGNPQFLKTNQYAIRIFPPLAQQAEFEAGLAHKLGKNRIAVVVLEDELTGPLGDAINAKLVEQGKQVVFRQTLSPHETDFRTIILKLKSTKPDLIYAHVLTRTGLFVRKLRELGISTPIIALYWIQQPEQMEVAGKQALENVIFTEIGGDKPAFRKAYEAVFPNQEYNAAAYLCYAMMSSMLDAALLPGALQSREALRDALLKMTQVQLLDGPVAFNNREIQFELAARRFKNAVPVPIH